MSTAKHFVFHAELVDEQLEFTLVEFCAACHAEVEQLLPLVNEGVLNPSGDGPGHWRFGGHTLPRARTALRLSRDLELSASGTALVLDLLDNIEALKSELRRLGRH